MRLIRNGEIKNTAVALGNFDGLHLAHMSIINACRDYAKENGLQSGVLLFSEHTLNVIKNASVKLITDEQEKCNILEKSGLDFAYIRSFTKEFSQLSPSEFVDELVSTLNPKAVFVGYDYRFGYKAEGDINLLRELGKAKGFSVFATEEIIHNGISVKSTVIRHMIETGNISGANEFLGRMFTISGVVEYGFQNGRKIGVPTVNVGYNENMILPENGVYSGYTKVGEKLYKSVINVGNNPTFNADKITVESHLLGFDGDIYGEKVSVMFKNRIRDEKKFASIDELKRQIQTDIAEAERMD